MNFAFVMDPLETVKAHKDTTYFLMLAASERGHRVFYVNQRDVFLRQNTVMAEVTPVDVHANIDTPFTVHPVEVVALADMDAVLIRTDPPFDRRYFYLTLMMDFLPATTRVYNHPAGLRDWNEKLAALHFPTLTPATCVTSKRDEIIEFAKQHERLTLKPVDGFGGQGIEFISADDHSAALDAIDRVTKNGQHWVIAQQYLPEAAAGDKRILLLDGEPMGAVLRLHADDIELNNLDAGGSANAADLDERDLQICTELKPQLIERGVMFCGIDVIGGYLIEINVTSPTCLQELCQFSGQDFHHQVIARMEQR